MGCLGLHTQMTCWAGRLRGLCMRPAGSRQHTDLLHHGGSYAPMHASKTPQNWEWQCLACSFCHHTCVHAHTRALMGGGLTTFEM